MIHVVREELIICKVDLFKVIKGVSFEKKMSSKGKVEGAVSESVIEQMKLV